MRSRGFSIAETLLAMGLVASVLLLVVNMFPQAWWLSRMKQHQLQASTLAGSVLADLACQAQPAAGVRDLDPVTLDGIVFLRRQEVQLVPGAPRLAHLRVSVSWTSLTRQPQTLVQELDVCHLEAL